MAEFYLCSRAEILRKVNMDTGRKIAIVGAPSDFIEWMEKVLPYDTCIVDEPDQLLNCCILDIIIYWEPDESRNERLGRLREILSEQGDLWIASLRGENREKLISDLSVDRNLIVSLTPMRDLIPLVIGARKSKIE